MSTLRTPRPPALLGPRWLTEAELVEMSRRRDQQSLRSVAFHESGHAVVAFVLYGQSWAVEIAETEGLAFQDSRLSLQRLDEVVEARDSGRTDIERWTERQRDLMVALDDDLGDLAESVVENTRSRLRASQQISLAGPLAQSRHVGIPLAQILETVGRWDADDWEHLEGLLSRLTATDRGRDMADTQAAAAKLLDDHWPRVERLAAALFVKRRLEPRDVEELLR